MQATEHAPSHMLSVSELLKSGIPIGYTTATYKPPCECLICQTQYRTFERQAIDEFTYKNKLEDKDAQALLAANVKQILDDREFIRATLQRCGNALLNWWRTRRPSARTSFLEHAAPELPKMKETQADYQGRRHTSVYKVVNGTQRFMQQFMRQLWETKQADRKSNRQAFLLPYLNIPSLAKEPFTLLALLQTRANSQLEDWVAFDNDQLSVNWYCGFFDVEFNPGCVVLHGSDYGKLNEWEREGVHRGDSLGFPRAQILIEAQATLMETLRRILEKALERIPPSPCEGLDAFADFISAGRLSSQTSSAWSSYVHQPTSDPPRLDLSAHISEVRARIEDLGDELWLLQTEPVYFRRYSRLIGQTSAAQTFRGSDWANELLIFEIQADLEKYWFWQGVLIELEHTKGVYDRFRDDIGPGSALPKRVANVLGALETLLAQGIDLRGKQLRSLLHERPAFTGKYNHVYDKVTMSSTSRLKKVPDIPEPATEHKTHRLWWCLGNLLGPYDMPSRLPYPLLLNILDDHLGSAGSSERNKMDEILYEKFSDFATMIKLLEALRFHRPTYVKREAEDCKDNEDRLGWRRLHLGNPAPAFVSSPGVLHTLKTLQNSRPPAGAKSIKWLQTFDDDHAALQAFWQSLLMDYREWNERRKFNVEDAAHDLQALEFWKSEDYNKRLEAKRHSVLFNIKKRNDVDDEIAFLPLPTMTTNEPVSVSRQPKQKIKTQGEVHIVDQKPETNNHLATNVLPAQILVPKRALSVFRSMFPDTLQERSAEVEWDTFVLSMVDAGFSSRNGGGSIVIFEETSGIGKIIFHRPHPSPKIDPIMLQSMGRRMNKWFAWNWETFAIAAKVNKAGG